RTAVRRPTTSAPVAAVVGERGGDALLDWLEVEQRHHLDGTGSALAEAARRPPAGRRARREATPGTPGIVLLDLPDLDPVQSTNRSVAERMTGLVDVLVWVTDPQKYADAVFLQVFERPLAGPDAVTSREINKAVWTTLATPRS